MTTINQKRIYKKINFCWSVALSKKPQLRGRVLKVITTTPRKPNSALRKIVRVLLSNKKKIFCKVPGSGSLPQKYSIVLVRGKGCKDTPSVKYSVVRGVYDCISLFQKKRKRSLYGSQNNEKIYIKKSLRRKMGSIGIISVFLSILFFNLILFLLTNTYSLFFSKWGKQQFYRDFYECGFKSISDNKFVLDIHFSIIGIIFLVYEMEIILFVPIFLNSYNMPFCLLLVVLLSILILSLSYWYEWERYGLNWLF